MKTSEIEEALPVPSLTETSLKSLSGIILVTCLRKIVKSDYQLLNAFPCGTNMLRLDGFSLNLILDYFSKICPKNSFH